MKDSREAIIARIEAACAGGDAAAARERLRRHPRNSIPARARASGEEARALFIDMAEAAGASVARLKSAAEIPRATADFLKARGLPARLRAAGVFRGTDFPELEAAFGPAEAADAAGLSMAFRGVAETGTLMTLSGPDSPASLNFLPEHHIVALAAADIVGAYEDAWEKMRTAAGAPPRVVNWITGPSRTADIEQTLVMGAHGPRRLHILLIEGEEA